MINASDASYQDMNEQRQTETPEELSKQLNQGVQAELKDWEVEDDLKFTVIPQ